MTMSGTGADDDSRPAVASAPPHSRPSPIFLALLLGTVVSGWALWNGIGPPDVLSFLFVLLFWVVSLSLHEFAHALVAFRNGDVSVAYRGYLTLDPLRYTHAIYSLVLPLIFLIAGGIGLPGGAVFVNRAAIRTRFGNAAVSAAGPLTNVAIALVLAIALTLRQGSSAFWLTLSFLLFLQVTAAVLNLLPVPGLDGFGIIQPYLSNRTLAALSPIAPFAIFGLFALLWVPAINAAFFSAIIAITTFLGVPSIFVWSGFALFRFWS